MIVPLNLRSTRLQVFCPAHLGSLADAVTELPKSPFSLSGVRTVQEGHHTGHSLARRTCKICRAYGKKELGSGL